MITIELNLMLLITFLTMVVSIVGTLLVIYFKREVNPEAIDLLQKIIKTSALASADGKITAEELKELFQLIQAWILLVFPKKENINIPPIKIDDETELIDNKKYKLQ